MTKILDAPHATSAERILTTALDLFAIKGYDATSVREICEAAGITKPTLYHFFGSKDGVLKALVQTGFQQYRALVIAAMDTSGSFEERVKVLARSVFQSASQKPLFWRFIHSVIWAPPGTALPQTETCTQFYDGVVGVLAAAAERAVARGEIAPGPIGARMLILMGSIGEAATGFVIAGKPELTPALADEIVETIFNGWRSSAMRTALIFLVGILFTTGVASAQPLSRADAVAQALASNPTVKLSLEQVALLEGRIVEAKADALPDITWNTFAMRSRDPGLLNSPNFDEFPVEFRDALRPLPGNAFSTTADIRQTIFSFKLGKALEAARVARVAGDQDTQRARQVTALDAIRAYNQLLFAIEQLRVISTDVQSKQTHVDYARNRRTAGVATELEVLRAEVDLENARAEALRAENEVSGARALLNTVMVRPTSDPIVPTDSLAVVPFAADFDAAITEALVARPELQLLRTQERVQTLLVDVTAADMKPSVEFNGAYGFAVRRPTNLFDVNYSRWSAGIHLKVPLFDGRRTNGRVAQAVAQRNTVTEQIAALENQIRLEVQSALDALALANRTMQAAELNVTQARRASEMTEANYKLGAATQLDVVDAQQSLRQAENIRNLSLYTHANARAALRFVMGRDPLE